MVLLRHLHIATIYCYRLRAWGVVALDVWSVATVLHTRVDLVMCGSNHMVMCGSNHMAKWQAAGKSTCIVMMGPTPLPATGDIRLRTTSTTFTWARPRDMGWGTWSIQ